MIDSLCCNVLLIKQSQHLISVACNCVLRVASRPTSGSKSRCREDVFFLLFYVILRGLESQRRIVSANEVMMIDD
jgi:hypothetical protein